MNVDRLFTVVDRELRTVARTRSFLAVGLGFAAVVVGLAWSGGAASYVTTTLDLLTPVEVLVPAVAVAFGYRAVLGDIDRGEIEMVRTFPVTRAEFVLGVYLGRAGWLVPVVLLPLAVSGLLVALSGGPGTTVIASHAASDSPLLFVRFVALTIAFALVALAVAVAVSAVARSVRAAIALGVAALVVLVVGLDLGIVLGLAGGLDEGAVQWLLAASPNSAYRGLVLETVVQPVTATGVRTAAPVASALGLAAWLAGALLAATFTVWRA
jgi:ABC-2 type transport system permease protein